MNSMKINPAKITHTIRRKFTFCTRTLNNVSAATHQRLNGFCGQQLQLDFDHNDLSNLDRTGEEADSYYRGGGAGWNCAREFIFGRWITDYRTEDWVVGGKKGEEECLGKLIDSVWWESSGWKSGELIGVLLEAINIFHNLLMADAL